MRGSENASRFVTPLISHNQCTYGRYHLFYDDDNGRRSRRVKMSDAADLYEFARLLGDFVSVLFVQYPPKMLADGSRVADVDLVLNAVCISQIVVFCREHVDVFFD